MKFIGRKKELEILERLRLKNTSSMAVIWGRRRIGKSRLIDEFLKKKKAWIFSGLPPTTTITHQEQINVFAGQMARNIGMPELKTSDWGEVFWHLGNQSEKESHLVIVLDEISWIASKDSNFLGYLKTEWDRSFSKHPNLIFILCGSVSSWIEKNILSNTGFLGRISIKLEVKELLLPECNEFWSLQNSRISGYEKLKILGITGGVPKYLEEIIPGESAEKNISSLCFTPSGLLFREYDQIFSDLFLKRAPTFDKIIKILSDGSKNLTEICKDLEMDKSNVCDYLHELVVSGYVSEDITWNIKNKKSSNLKKFRLKDNYIRFYLNFIFPNKSRIENGIFFDNSLSNLSGWEIILGYQFENLVINNLVKLYELIGIDIHQVEQAGPFFQKKTAKNSGCQIDLLIQTKFGTLYVCEMKFYMSEVKKQVVQDVETKITRLVCPKGYSIRPILIHVNGVTQGVKESGFFDKIIDFNDLLGE